MPVTTESPDEIVRRIMQQPIPLAGQLTHPLHKEPKKTKQLTVTDIRNFSFPIDINAWNSKMFVDYFAKKYQEVTNANYRRVYRSDIMIIQNMGDFLVSNGLDRNKWTKRLIDWAVNNKDEIIRREGHFTLQEVLSQINYFYQQEVLPRVEDDAIERDTQDTVLLEEIQKADAEGRITQVFARFGIPVAITYLVKVRDVDEDAIIDATEQRLKTLCAGSVLDKEQAEKIFQASIIGSPYPEEFLLLDWRSKFKEYTKPYTKQLWWRPEDYKGKPLAKYYSLL